VTINQQFAAGTQWDSWMQDFRYGTLAFVPGGELRAVIDELRQRFDPESARTSMAHATLTQPFAEAPSDTQLESVRSLIANAGLVAGQVGPAVTSPNKKLLWFDVLPKEPLVGLRDQLHQTALFRTDLPLTKGFIPHMTISERPRPPEEVSTILTELNQRHGPWPTSFEAVAWIVPNEDFIFEIRELFPMTSGS
jgi:2'-5' RNA ligase